MESRYSISTSNNRQPLSKTVSSLSHSTAETHWFRSACRVDLGYCWWPTLSIHSCHPRLSAKLCPQPVSGSGLSLSCSNCLTVPACMMPSHAALTLTHWCKSLEFLLLCLSYLDVQYIWKWFCWCYYSVFC